jgi:hypothetical protein
VDGAEGGAVAVDAAEGEALLLLIFFAEDIMCVFVKITTTFFCQF